MERFAVNAIRHDTYSDYWCDVETRPFLTCLDIAAPSTLGKLLNAAQVADFADEAGHNVADIQNVSTTNTSQLFGQQVACSGKNVGDGVINVFDMSTLLHIIFHDPPYASVSLSEPTVAGRDDLACRPTSSRSDYYSAYFTDSCTSSAPPSESRRLVTSGHGSNVDSFVRRVDDMYGWPSHNVWFGPSAFGASWYVLDVSDHIIYQVQVIFYETTYNVDANRFYASTPSRRRACEQGHTPCLLFEYACADDDSAIRHGCHGSTCSARFMTAFSNTHVVNNATAELYQAPVAQACSARLHFYSPHACQGIKSILASTHRGAMYLRSAYDPCLARSNPASNASSSTPDTPVDPTVELSTSDEHVSTFFILTIIVFSMLTVLSMAVVCAASSVPRQRSVHLFPQTPQAQ